MKIARAFPKRPDQRDPAAAGKRQDALIAQHDDRLARRLAARQEHSAPLMADLQAWLSTQLARLSRNHDLAKAINYMLRRWSAFTRFLDDGRVCITNNAAERALRGITLGRKSWLFCGSDRGGQRAAVMYSLIGTAKLNAIDPQAWLADVLARIAAYPAHRLPIARSACASSKTPPSEVIRPPSKAAVTFLR